MRPALPCVLTALLATACTTVPPPAAPAAVVLVSLDGFRADYLDLGITPNLSRLAREGVRAEWMTPSYPTLTFPNHYTLVTGLRPDRHGIVHNTMRDASLGRFSLGNRDAIGDGRWWGGEPAWVTIERAGLPTATMFWPGSEAAIGGVRPTRWMPFDETMTSDARVDTVLGWLGEDAATRPRFATLYFDSLDHDSHDHGPDSPEARRRIVELDNAIGRLVEGIAAQRRPVNLVIVSDHGMAEVAPGRMVAVEDMVDRDVAESVTLGQVVGFVPRPGREAQAGARLLGRYPHYECWRKQELPARWQYGTHARIPPIVCQMDEGWDAGTRKSIEKRATEGSRGSHGFAPELPSMRAVFVANGPAFRRGARIGAFDNVHVYPLLMRLAGVTAVPGDGDARVLEPALAE